MSIVMIVKDKDVDYIQQDVKCEVYLVEDVFLIEMLSSRLEAADDGDVKMTDSEDVVLMEVFSSTVEAALGM